MHSTKLNIFRKHLVALAVLSAFAGGAAADIIDLGVQEGGYVSAAHGVSADGSVVVGYGDQCSGAGCSYVFRAFRWTPSGGMSSLDGLSSNGNSNAYGVSADGRIIVGYAEDSQGNAQAVRWTPTGIAALGSLNGGTWSEAYAISANGNVIVGTAQNGNAGGQYTAFRWTVAGGMASLGTLPGGSYSSAKAVNSDGTVVVGASDFNGFGNRRAFRWTETSSTMENLGTLTGSNYSAASGVSGDGRIVVGGSTGLTGERAFRWEEGHGMFELGGLGGSVISQSWANGISSDGQVIVGRATDPTASGAWRSFRWTAADGMITVEQWLRNNGVTVAADMTGSADATNRDGSVVIGMLDNGRAYIARVSGLIDVAEFNTSLAGVARLPTLLRSSSDLVLNGAHGSPMRGLLAEGRSSVWTAGDWGRSDRNARNDEMATGEVGWSRGLAHGWQVKLAVGKTYDVAGFATGGEGRLSGTHVLPEVIWNVAGNLHATFSGYYQQGEAEVRRGYLNAGTQTYSSGNADINVIGGRLRLDWLNAFALGGVALTPYTSLTSLHTKIDGYTETGGGFAAQWNKRSGETNILRAGVDAVYPLALSGVTLLGRVEGAWRAEENGPRSTGQTLGLGSFDFADSPGQRAWLRGSLGAESSLGGGILSLILNGTSHGGSPDYSLAANYRVDF